ncbi:MAG: tetratricopeptide repeat protein [Pseudomonadota bacterium]
MLIVPHLHHLQTQAQRKANPDQGTHHDCAQLTRRDLMALEPRLCEALHGLLPFKAHSLYFPQEIDTVTPLWVSEESKLLLPLIVDDALLGVFVARGVTKRLAQKMLPHLPHILNLCLENITLYKAQCTDATTGFITREHLIASMAYAAESVRTAITEKEKVLDEHKQDSSKGVKTSRKRSAKKAAQLPDTMRAHYAADLPLHRTCMGLIVLQLSSLAQLSETQGYAVAEKRMAEIATALRDIAPQDALLARSNDYEICMLLPTASSRQCHKVAEEAVVHLRRLPSTQQGRSKRQNMQPLASISAGYAMYPRDIEGLLFERDMHEQARALLRKARLAAQTALTAVEDQGHHYQQGISYVPVMAFASILAEGGFVLETHPLSRLVVNLGRNVHAREGQHFSVWSLEYPVQKSSQYTLQNQGLTSNTSQAKQALFKGEIVLLDVRENNSVAEILYLGDPTWSVAVGDRLALLPDEFHGTVNAYTPYTTEKAEQNTNSPHEANAHDHSKHTGQQGSSTPHVSPLDPVTGLYRHGDFLAHWNAQRDASDIFCLAILRFNHLEQQADQTEHVLMKAVRLVHTMLGHHILGGRYGLNSLIFYHPNMTAQEAQDLYTELCSLLTENLMESPQLELAVGIGVHPFLDFRRADALDNALKALEYGLLLPKPHIGILDSVALTISADKHFSRNDTFAAIAEYKQALLADDSNVMAWNSLGVCLASLGKHRDAQRYFEEVLARQAHDAMAHYNLGTVCQDLGEITEARKHYLQCIKHSPDHTFAFIRLGQLAENEGRFNVARKYYKKAAHPPTKHSVGKKALDTTATGPENSNSQASTSLGSTSQASTSHVPNPQATTGSKSSTEALGLVHRLLARLAIREGRPDQAREALHEALLANPQDATALHIMARLYLDGGEDPSMAEALSRRSVNLRPNAKAAWLVLARALEAQGRTPEAREALLRAGDL